MNVAVTEERKTHHITWVDAGFAFFASFCKKDKRTILDVQAVKNW